MNRKFKWLQKIKHTHETAWDLILAFTMMASPTSTAAFCFVACTHNGYCAPGQAHLQKLQTYFI